MDSGMWAMACDHAAHKGGVAVTSGPPYSALSPLTRRGNRMGRFLNSGFWLHAVYSSGAFHGITEP